MLPSAPWRTCLGSSQALPLVSQAVPSKHGAAAIAPCLQVALSSPTARLTNKQRRGQAVCSFAGLAQLIEAAAVSPNRDLYCLAFTIVGSLVWVKVFDLLASSGIVEQKLSRKLVHITTGPLFAVTWALFSTSPQARFLAAVAPLLNLARLVSVASGVVRDDGLVASVSRSGDKSELLKGPAYYCLVLIFACVFFWRNNPAGLVALSLMCGGDGLADIVGRRLGHLGRLPHNPSKSWAGSIAMFLGGLCFSLGFVGLFCFMGFFPCVDSATLLPALTIISAAATVVESLPINTVIDDNLSVPILAAGLSLLLLPVSAMAVPVFLAASPLLSGLAMSAMA